VCGSPRHLAAQGINYATDPPFWLLRFIGAAELAARSRRPSNRPYPSPRLRGAYIPDRRPFRKQKTAPKDRYQIYDFIE
jgi:hypothetical protein